MPPLVKQLGAIKDPKSRLILESLLEGELYYERSGFAIVRAQMNDDKKYVLSYLLTDAQQQTVSKSKIKKIRTNNRLRGQIRDVLAKLDLTDPDSSVRIEALKQLIDKPNDSAIQTIKELLAEEKDEDVNHLMQVILQVQLLKTGDDQQKLAAVEILKTSLEPAVKNMLTQQLAVLPKKPTDQQQIVLKKAITDALDTIESKRQFYGVVENIFFGLSLGSVLLLAAIGLAITFGVMGVINMAHGEMIMLGAYTTYVVQLIWPHLIEYSLFIAIPLAFLVSGSVGIIIERCVIRFLKGRPLETLLATFGISLILQQLVRTVFSPLNRQVAAPEWMSGSLQINPVFSLTYNRLYIIIFSLMVFFALLTFFKKSSLGLHVRAVSQNREMARALSIKSDWVDAITFGLGSGIAGVAGVVLSQLTNVGPNLGQAYIIDSFLVVVFGGVGNLWGTLVAAMSLGSINKFLEPITGSVLANIIVLVGLVLFIQKRPKGLFPQKGRSAD
ncbi:urea ABC transporter permease subunit UrtB [Paraglaciecola aquimarina]|uniref:Urea ABC transporter permease subunit UrtB n=2 Tax=Paraglaciecola algarum TaxID=3050085 RepID=A0ABS9D5I7_9ALTE|nr:urea ABC transporter permease subunit UrtB [Paraglaciecola sp. G1-23]MCF2947944.1 urea ABC transporter permease subunit UrtB [Paraglaciecola sp. G1-23]